MDKSWKIIVWLACVGVVLGAASGVGISLGSDFVSIQRLKKDLFLNYDHEVLPLTNFSKPINVTIGFNLLQVDINELASQMNAFGWLRLRWTDERLRWNEADYEGVDVLRVPIDKIWRPDVVLYNMPSVDGLEKLGKTNALVYPNGNVLWVPPANYDAVCELNFRLWPRDTQSCKLKIGSWTQSGKEILLTLYHNETTVDVDLFSANPKWEVTRTHAVVESKFYECCPGEPYLTAAFEITVKRNSSFYAATIIVPAIVIIGLTLASFLIPPNRGAKLAFGLVNVLILVGYIVYFSTQLPATDASLPTVVVFYQDVLLLVALSLVISAPFIWWTSSPQVTGPPRVLMQYLNGRMGELLGLGSIVALISANRNSILHKSEPEAPGFIVTDNEKGTEAEEQDFGPSTKSPNTELAHLQWLLLAGAVDRILLVVYSVAFAILGATCLQM